MKILVVTERYQTGLLAAWFMGLPREAVKILVEPESLRGWTGPQQVVVVDPITRGTLWEGLQALENYGCFMAFLNLDECRGWQGG